MVLPKRAHLVGIGGISMSAVAKLLLREGVRVSGSDANQSEATRELATKGIEVKFEHRAENVPPETELLIYSSAVPEDNPERAAARQHGIRQLNNFQFLGEWTQDKQPILVCGTHGKSTTTALAGLMLIKAGLDPTVIVGSRVPGFAEGNIYFGGNELVVIEGDEYEKHFLEFEPSAVVLNNLELDHTDVYADTAAVGEAFRDLLKRLRPGGLVVANADDPRLQTLIGQERARLEGQGVKIKTFGFGSHVDVQVVDNTVRAGEQSFALRGDDGLVTRFLLHVPGRMNVMNAAGAVALAISLQVPTDAIRRVLGNFSGIWRRFEKVGEMGNVVAISDYGHHPTAVAATLDAAKAWYPGRRIVLCFQPHHRNRTKHLFADFVPCFDKADALLLVEIFDVPGREAAEDQDVSSRDLQDAVARRDAERGTKRLVDFARDPADALEILKRWRRPGDVIIVMGAGDIYKIALKVLD